AGLGFSDEAERHDGRHEANELRRVFSLSSPGGEGRGEEVRSLAGGNSTCRAIRLRAARFSLKSLPPALHSRRKAERSWAPWVGQAWQPFSPEHSVRSGPSALAQRQFCAEPKPLCF